MPTYQSKLTQAKLAIAKRPTSKATALRWYLKEHTGILHNKVTKELRDELSKAMQNVKGRNAPAIIEISRDCVGKGAEAYCVNNVRNCEIKDCLLFNVRPYQNKSKVRIKNIMPRTFSEINNCQVMHD